MNNPFNDYGLVEMTSFNPINTQLNTKYKDVAKNSFVTTEQESFFQNKTQIAGETLATPCEKDSICNLPII